MGAADARRPLAGKLTGFQAVFQPAIDPERAGIGPPPDP